MDKQEAKIYNYKLNFYTVSPLHIGTGEDIEPFSYVIKNGHLYYYDLTKFLLMINDNQRKELLKRISNPGSAAIMPVRKYLAELFDPEQHKDTLLYDYEIKYKNVIKYYDERFTEKKKDTISSLAISTIYRNHFHNAVLPGSSIKGMVRSAFIKLYGLENTEKELPIDKDPFKFVKIYDGVRKKTTIVNVAFIHHILKDKLEIGENTQTSLIEFIAPRQPFYVEFKVDLTKQYSKFNNEYFNGISTHFTSGKALINMLNKFYKPKFDKLYNIILKQAGEDHPFIQNVEKCRAAAKNGVIAFVQLGKYGGQEMYGGEGQKKLKYRRYLSYNQIEHDADLYMQNLMPLGWVAVL